MPASTKSNVETCPSCGALIDVSEEDPFALVNCSGCGAEMRVRKEFVHFEIQGILGEGGQGMVFRGLDKKLHRPVAIKLMKREYSADPNFVKRFESEAQITASLNHPNIVKVFSFGKQRDLLYLAMEIVDYGSLDALMSQLKKVPEDTALSIGIQIANGLKAGLDRGLIDRDIKPGNILLADEHTAKIVDFGLAVLVEKQHEDSGDVWATPYYVSPEKLDGRPEDFRSDMYSLAATLFHAIAGRPPFMSESNSMTELRQIKSRPVQLHSYAPHVSPATAFAIDKALSVDPNERFQSYDEFIHNLEYARGDLKKHHGSAPVPHVVTKSDPARGGSWVTFAVVALIVGGGVYAWVHRERLPSWTGLQNPASSTQTNPNLSAEAVFDEGRRQLVEGKFQEAAATFHNLYEAGRLAEPKNSWAAVHEGFAENLAGHPGRARNAFKALVERIAPTAIGLDPKLVAFMTRLAAFGSDKKQFTPADLEQFDTSSYEALAFLVIGVRKWETGLPEEGAALFRQFQAATPSGEAAWVADYRPIATRFVEEYAAYLEITSALAKADEAPAQAEAALKRLPVIKRTFTSPVLLRNLAALERESAAKVASASAAAKAAIDKQQIEAEARDEKLLTEAKFRLKDLCENYRFAEALATIRPVDVKLDRSVAERQLLSRRIEWLVQFKQHLIDDLNSGSYMWPIVRKNGQQLIGGVKHATDQQLEIRVQFGSLPIAWSDLSAQTVLQMARAYMRPTLPASAIADRKWEAGVFCLFAQLFNEGQTLMNEAASQKDEYRTHRASFFGQTAPDSTQTPAPKPAPGEKPADDAQPSSGIEMADGPLNLNRTDPNSTVIKGLHQPGTP